MKLREYIMFRRIDINWSVKKMAQEIDISAVHLYGVSNLHISPSWPLSKRIEKYSEGKVRAVDLMNAEYGNKNPNKKPQKKRRIMKKNVIKDEEIIPQTTSG